MAGQHPPTTHGDQSDHDLLVEIRANQIIMDKRIDGLATKFGDLSRWAFGSGTSVGLNTNAALFGQRLETVEEEVSTIRSGHARLFWIVIAGLGSVLTTLGAALIKKAI